MTGELNSDMVKTFGINAGASVVGVATVKKTNHLNINVTKIDEDFAISSLVEFN